MIAFGLRLRMKKIMRGRKAGHFGSEKEEKCCFLIVFKILLIRFNVLDDLAHL